MGLRLLCANNFTEAFTLTSAFVTLRHKVLTLTPALSSLQGQALEGRGGFGMTLLKVENSYKLWDGSDDGWA